MTNIIQVDQNPDQVINSLPQSLDKFGVSKIFPLDVGESLSVLWGVIYDLTCVYLVDHDAALPLEHKVRLSFKSRPSGAIWSRVMKDINESSAFQALVRHPSIVAAYQSALGVEPVIFPITVFRARLPGQDRAVYTWHQDMGTWYIAKNKELARVNAYTLWLSVNGADETDSVEFIPGSHKDPLYVHENVSGQGAFAARLPSSAIKRESFVIRTSPGQGIMFSPMLLHRSMPQTDTLRPRYSIDIRYFNPNEKAIFEAPFFYRMERMLKPIFQSKMY